MTIRVPWRVRIAARRVRQRVRGILSRLPRRRSDGIDISVYCDHSGTTGATIAIACIANQLAVRHNVDAFVRPHDGIGKLLSLRVRQTFSAAALRGDITFVNIEQDSATLEKLLADGRHLVLSCHALPTVLHAVPQPVLTRNIELATFIHFVSEFQQLEFSRAYPALNIESKSFVIHNHTRQSAKHSSTGNVGIVGYLNRPKKNAIKAIQLAQQSSARLIQCWGSETIAGLEDRAQYPKLRVRGWADSMSAMHDSFDVLISTSQFETFGLGVTEALSAGIPCALSDIPVFRALYAACPGVVILSGDDARDVQSINRLLEIAPALKQDTIDFWREHFSNETIAAEWFEKISDIHRSMHPSPAHSLKTAD